MRSDHTVPVRAGRSAVGRDASHIHALRYAGRVAARQTPRGGFSRIVMFIVARPRGDSRRQCDRGPAGVQRPRQRAVGRAARPRPTRDPDLRRADDDLRPDRQGRARGVRRGGPPGGRLRRGPAAGPRCDDDRRGPHVLGEQRVRRGGHRRRRGPGRQWGQRARRLDHHPAARPGPAAARRTRPRRAPTSTCARPRRSSSRCACPTRSRASWARIGSSRPISTRSSTATARTGSQPRPRSTSASATCPS